MPRNPNIYEGDKATYRNIVLSVKLPDGLTEDEELEFLSNLFLSMKFGQSFVSYKQGLKQKTLSINDILTKGWEYA